MRAQTVTSVPENQPAPIHLDILRIDGIPPALTDGVSATGYTRHVVVEDRLIGQMVISELAGHGRAQALDATTFTGQFDLAAPKLSPDEPVTLNGDKALLLAALQALHGEEHQQVARQDGDDGEDGRDGAVTTSPAAGISASGGENPDAAAYKVPEPMERKPDQISTEVVTDGCNVRVDVGQLVAIQQNKVVVVENGERTEGACEDGGDRFPLKRSYAACKDVVDLGGRQATAHYQLFYVDGGGTRNVVSECQPDPDRTFKITETLESCPISMDWDRGVAVPQAELSYINGENARIVVRGCAAAESKTPVKLVQTVEGCTVRHDFGKGLSVQQARFRYSLDGRDWLVGACADTETIFTHRKVFDDDGGRRICEPLVNRTNKTVTEQYRLQITADGRKEYITPCAPEAGSAIERTEEGCQNPLTWVHDLAAQVSYPKHREFYRRPNGKREYLTACKAGERSIKHSLEAVSYQNDDAKLTALPLHKVTVAAASGPFTVAEAMILPGAEQSPYIKVETVEEPTGKSVLEGCNAIGSTRRLEVWRRPDGTTFKKDIGPGTPTSPQDVCSGRQETKTEYSHTTYRAVGLTRQSGSSVSVRRQPQGTRTDGPFVGCTFHRPSQCKGRCSASCEGMNYNRIMGRDVRTAPDGTVHTGPWVKQREIPSFPFQARDDWYEDASNN